MKTMKKNLLALGIILMSALTFTACSDDNGYDDGVQPSLSSTNTYIPCAGNYMKNDGTVGLLDYNTGNRPMLHSFIMTHIRHRMVQGLAMHKTLSSLVTRLSLQVQVRQSLKFLTV
nr:hypothetical protein [Prevotella veroralis]